MSEPAAPRSNIALIVSLCVNLLLAGVIAMAVFRFVAHQQERMQPQGTPPQQQSTQPPERAQVRQLLSPKFLTHLAPQKADQIRDIVDAHREKLDHLKVEANAARREVLTIFGAPTLDQPALGKALARTQAADAAIETEIMKVAAEVAAKLSPEERKKAADWRGHHFGGPMGWHPGNEDGRFGPRPRDGDRPDGDSMQRHGRD